MMTENQLEALYRELSRMADRLLRFHIARNSFPRDLYGDDTKSLLVEIVVDTIERLQKIEATKGPSPNVLGRCYLIMNNVILEKAKDLWTTLKAVGRQETDERRLAQVPDLSSNEMEKRIALEQLQLFVRYSLPAVYEEVRTQLYQETGNKIFADSDFLPGALTRLNGTSARAAWKAFQERDGGSWQNVEKLYLMWRRALAQRLITLGWTGAI